MRPGLYLSPCMPVIGLAHPSPRREKAGSITWFQVAYSYRLCPGKEDRNSAFSPSLCTRSSKDWEVTPNLALPLSN